MFQHNALYFEVILELIILSSPDNIYFASLVFVTNGLLFDV